MHLLSSFISFQQTLSLNPAKQDDVKKESRVDTAADTYITDKNAVGVTILLMVKFQLVSF